MGTHLWSLKSNLQIKELRKGKLFFKTVLYKFECIFLLLSMNYKESTSLESRCQESKAIRAKHPDRVPCIVMAHRDSIYSDLKASKFLISNEYSLAQFYCIVRKRLNIRADQSIFFYCKNTIPSAQTTIASLYDDFKNEDGFLYLTYSEE